MESAKSVHNTLENLNAVILATDPSDAEAVASLKPRLSEIVDTLDPNTRVAELLELAISCLDKIDILESTSVLDAVTTAVSVSSEHADDASDQKLDALEKAAAGIREILGPSAQESVTAEPKETEAGLAEVTEEEETTVDGQIPECNREMLPEYLVESRDHIAASESAILVLEVNPDESESLNSVLRAFHTIKGSSGLLGLPRIQSLAHQAEHLLIQIRDGKMRMDQKNCDLSLQACDTMKFMLDELETTPPDVSPAIPENFDELLEALSKCDELAEPEETVQADAAEAEAPAVEEISETPSEPAAQPTAAEAPPEPTETPQPPAAETRPVSPAASKPAAGPTVKQPPQSAPRASELSVRVNMRRLDDLLNAVGELVIAHSIVAQDMNQIEGEHSRLARSIAHADKTVRQLQDLAMSLRMVPFQATFQKMARIARDVATKSGKSVRFTTTGDDTEIDRNMVQVLNDPLMHMVRNAIDHGIEPAEERVAKGKPAQGTLHLRALHAAGSVVIELEDDGKGLNRDKILKRAIENGMVESGREMSDDEVYSLIIQPGFSTAEKVTDLSGRGVGMDVVQRNVESLRGHLSVTSEPGVGTKITMTVPLTTAILDAMLLRIGEQRYLVPTIVIHTSFRPEHGAISTIAEQAEMVMLHGQLYPLFRLNALFGIDDAVSDPHEAMVLIIEGVGKQYALMVDEILGQQQVVIKSLGKALGDVKGIAGGAILGDGNVGIILDTVALSQLVHDPVQAAESAAAYRLLTKNNNPTVASTGS